MAYLGRYYADKQRCAPKLMLYRVGGRREPQWHEQAVKHIEDAREHWKQYADVLESHYKTSLHAKTGWFRWYDTLKLVEDEVERVRGEGTLPVLEFVNPRDGDSFESGVDLEVKVNATARRRVRSGPPTTGSTTTLDDRTAPGVFGTSGRAYRRSCGMTRTRPHT